MGNHAGSSPAASTKSSNTLLIIGAAVFVSHERVDGSYETAKWSLMNSLLFLLKYKKCHEAHTPPLSKVYRTRPERSVERIAKDVEGLGYVKKQLW